LLRAARVVASTQRFHQIGEAFNAKSNSTPANKVQFLAITNSVSAHQFGDELLLKTNYSASHALSEVQSYKKSY
jgi:hypothetical protein